MKQPHLDDNVKHLDFRVTSATLNVKKDVDLTQSRTITIAPGKSSYVLRFKIDHTGRKRAGFATIPLANPRNANLGSIRTHTIILNDRGKK